MQTIKLIMIALTLWFTSQVAAQAPCSTPAHRQFDFWVGDWDVYATSGDTIVGHNTINNILGGCVIEENWTGGTGFQGKSFNTYNPQDSTWNQVWVDMGGATYHFKGQYKDNVMQMKGESLGRNGQKFLFDMSYHPQTNGDVRQIWKMSRDNGENWAITFDGMYRKKKD